LQLGVELIALAPLALANPTYFELLFSNGCQVIPDSFGKDEYMYPVQLSPYSRVAATGRKCIFLNHQQKKEDTYQAGPSELVEVAHPQNGNSHLLLHLASSLDLDRTRLAQDFVLNLITSDRQEQVPLRETAIDHSGNGKFVLDLSSLLRENHVDT
jgi:hypothetical protein